MPIPMREGQLVLGEGLLNGLVEPEIHGPVVAGLEPGAELEGGQASLGDGDQGFGGGVVQNQLVLFGTVEEQLADLLLVGGGAEGQIDVETPGLVGVQVLDGGIGEGSVGQRHLQVVRGGDGGVEQGDLLHRALMGAVADVVAHMEGAEDQQHDAAGQVGEGPLHRQAHGQAAAAQHRQNGSGGHAHGGDRHEDHQRVAKHLDGAGGEGLHLGGQLLELLAFLHQFYDHLHQPQADDEDQQSGHDLHSQISQTSADQRTQVQFVLQHRFILLGFDYRSISQPRC